MGIFSSTPEERAEKAARKAREERLKAEEQFNASPPGRARAARQSGAKIFQASFPLSHTVGRTVAMLTANASSTPTSDFTNTLELIEAEGWKLDHVGYVYRVTGSVSRDKFMSSGQEEAMHGEIVGIYLFRATEPQP